MLRKIQRFSSERPFEAWLMSAALMTAFSLGGYFLIPGHRNPALFMFFVVIGVSPSTSSLIRRMSDDEYDKNPVSLVEQQRMGMASLLAACCSIGSLLCIVLANRLGIERSMTRGAYVIVLFSLSSLLALAMGYAARRTSLGQLGARIAGWWIIGLFAVAMLGLLFAK